MTATSIHRFVRRSFMDNQKLLRKRDKLAQEAGEGVYWNLLENRQAVVRVTFYPKVKLWIEEDGRSRQVDPKELKEGYRRIEI